MRTIKIKYSAIEACPLCGSGGRVDRAKLSRPYYFFGNIRIPLPEQGVVLRECTSCSLLYKSAVPDRDSLSEVMSGGATEVWRQKSGVHPALTWILPYIKERPRVLDIGASNGDLLAQLKPYASCVSALDVVEYPRCRKIINGEYILGDMEGELSWSGKPYQIATAFDVFEHFVDADAALDGIDKLLSHDGRLIIETGDWTCMGNDLCEWYYANLFEHHIFWSRGAINYVCERYNWKLLEYRLVAHKNRRNLGGFKMLATELVVFLGKFQFFQSGMLTLGKGDPRRFARKNLVDHAFMVLGKRDA